MINKKFPGKQILSTNPRLKISHSVPDFLLPTTKTFILNEMKESWM